MASITSKLTINVPGMTTAQKNQYIRMLKYIAKKHQRYFGFPVDEKLRSIEVFGYNNRSAELIKFKALGVAFFDGRIQQVYMGDPRWDAQLWAMEHGHHVIMEALPWREYRDETNNLIHYAANVGHPYLIRQNIKYYATKWDALRRKSVALPMEWYNMNKILDDMIKINKAIAEDTAPGGPHQYWFTPYGPSMQKEGIAHVIDEAHLRGGHHHHH